jgi:hypothetical protein
MANVQILQVFQGDKRLSAAPKQSRSRRPKLAATSLYDEGGRLPSGLALSTALGSCCAKTLAS